MGETERGRYRERGKERERERDRYRESEGERDRERVMWVFVPQPLPLLKDKTHVGVRGHDCFAVVQLCTTAGPLNIPPTCANALCHCDPLDAVWVESTGNEEYWGTFVTFYLFLTTT